MQFTIKSDLDRDLVEALDTRHFPHGADETLASIILHRARNYVAHGGMHYVHAVDTAARQVHAIEMKNGQRR